jgi:hypothetical protein
MTKVKTVAVVTMKHGIAFAQGWYEGDMAEACTGTGIMTWPEFAKDAQGRYLDIEDEICHDVFEATKQQIAEAFVRVANAALARERRRRQ